ncbi:MAG: putative E3 ubiquitin-protein ligase MARCH8 [Harvfovirus sp.]|uniref:E3 ubiquitin-protein ligase LAP n=1 Tax=Harvfovirus sp. TaxID=2487768 RepID=A0A3G5A967_9VIRU|nr:MAG: putative E3 ubiquitin-protein ligase MARCH8 [Harvfovirus sp.]
MIPQCRICLDNCSTNFIAPCDCKGSIKYVHRSCIEKWQKINYNARIKCELCNQKFQYSIPYLTYHQKIIILKKFLSRLLQHKMMIPIYISIPSAFIIAKIKPYAPLILFSILLANISATYIVFHVFPNIFNFQKKRNIVYSMSFILGHMILLPMIVYFLQGRWQYEFPFAVRCFLNISITIIIIVGLTLMYLKLIVRNYHRSRKHITRKKKLLDKGKN